MKRGQPLRRTPLKAKPRPAREPGQPMPPRTRAIRAQSTRAAQVRRERAELARRLHGPQRCQWPGGCTSEAVDQDERLTRGRGGSATDPDNIVLLCRGHHDWKHNHPAQAQAMGLMPSQYVPRDR